MQTKQAGATGIRQAQGKRFPRRGVVMLSKDEFIRLIKKANYIHWSERKSSMTDLIRAIPDGGLLSRADMIGLQQLIWPVGDNPVWLQKKQKYKDALIYLATEGLTMPRPLAERVLLKKGEQKIAWEERRLPKDWEFTHVTTRALTELDPYKSREFCYPDNGLWYDWPANEFVFCLPKLKQKHQQKNFNTFGGNTLKLVIPMGTPYISNTDLNTAKKATGEIAFYHKLILAKPTVRPVLPR
jgi:hypothetical protein